MSEPNDMFDMQALEIDVSLIRAEIAARAVRAVAMERVLAAARAVDELYSGSYHGEVCIANIINNDAIEPATRFNELRAALDALSTR